jgi:hypothetical protein
LFGWIIVKIKLKNRLKIKKFHGLSGALGEREGGRERGTDQV